MPLKQGHIYRSPDGRRFRAKLDGRQYGPHRSWRLTPVRASRVMSREALEQQLFLRCGRVFRLDFARATIVVDTGWTAADLRGDG
jgi:hypothetical protein